MTSNCKFGAKTRFSSVFYTAKIKFCHKHGKNYIFLHLFFIYFVFQTPRVLFPSKYNDWSYKCRSSICPPCVIARYQPHLVPSPGWKKPLAEGFTSPERCTKGENIVEGCWKWILKSFCSEKVGEIWIFCTRTPKNREILQNVGLRLNLNSFLPVSYMDCSKLWKLNMLGNSGIYAYEPFNRILLYLYVLSM